MMLGSTKLLLLVIVTTLGLSACGGGDSSETWVQGQFASDSSLVNQCRANQTGSAETEKLWLRSWSNDTYLWYNEIVDLSPAPYTVAEYFDLLKTENNSVSGNKKDKYHFSMSTAEWEQLNQSGASVGYGLNFKLTNASQSGARNVTVTYNEPNSPASDNNLTRGAVIVEVDGVNVKDAADSASIDIIRAGLFPSQEGKETVFIVRDLDAVADRTVTLTAKTIISTPVQNTKTIQTPKGKVGYLQFNAHIATAERGLFDAVTTLSQAGINDLVIDLRYNGGGLLAMASQLGYMIAGKDATTNRTFEETSFNDKYPNTNPVNNQALSPMPFIDETLGFNTALLTGGSTLPTLDLKRVYVLTTSSTCSASEALMNGLRGVDIEVIQLGGTTCGKPYGFYPTPNCGTTYFTIQFKGVNDKGFGEYSDGFVPSTSPTLASEVQGCMLDDDLGHALGDTDERLLSAALYYRDNERCPAIAAGVARSQAVNEFIDEGFMLKDERNQSFLQNNRIIIDMKGAL
ncbi:peptidase [Shewanella sp. Choline-02u-19]|uniref:S41 family peptidase n=1 Tax=unclassified Shewanella TaxID=196818 RepID=UPI000C3427D6|nr:MULTISPECIES: S41 family peptidase [unclassified Shewanella]PKH53843.1 peptidase [Shewanella sp. Bg11-22]PKI28905.1 peptidase [Shewanella sp. Choline-02u-19]